MFEVSHGTKLVYAQPSLGGTSNVNKANDFQMVSRVRQHSLYFHQY